MMEDNLEPSRTGGKLQYDSHSAN